MNKMNMDNKGSSMDEDQRDETNLQGNGLEQEVDLNESDNVSDDSKELTEDDWQAKYHTSNDAYLRLMAEFDNYRKRTIKEKAELIKNGGESVIIGLLPVIDDFERALSVIGQADTVEGLQEGIDLIYVKFMDYLKRQGVEPIEAIGKPFDTEKFDAIAKIPAPSEELKGKVVDATQTGYTMHDKVIRHSKVVVGE